MLHKIPGIEISVCTAEQMIAYNYCNAYHDMSAELVVKIARQGFEKNNWMTKYDADTVCCLIAAHLGKTYRGEIASSYEAIGRWFPLNS